MPASTTASKALSVMPDAEPAANEPGMTQLRAAEARALIALSCDALSQASQVGHLIHSVIYKGIESDASLKGRLASAFGCMQVADHYLRMLSSVLDDERIPLDRMNLWSAEPVF